MSEPSTSSRSAGGSRWSDPAADSRITLCEAIDRVLHKGVIVAGEVTISVAGIDLVYVGTRTVITAVENAARMPMFPHASPTGGRRSSSNEEENP